MIPLVIVYKAIPKGGNKMIKLLNVRNETNANGQVTVLGTFVTFNEDKTQIEKIETREMLASDHALISEMAEAQSLYIDVKAKEQLAAKKVVATPKKVVDKKVVAKNTQDKAAKKGHSGTVAIVCLAALVGLLILDRATPFKTISLIWPTKSNDTTNTDGKPKPGDTTNTNTNTDKPKDTTVVVPAGLVEHEVTKAELVTKAEEIAKYLTSKGLSTDAQSVYSTLFLVNIDDIDQEVMKELETNNIIQDTSKKIIEDSFGLIGEIGVFNTTLAKQTPEKLDANMISFAPFVLASEKDKQNLLHIEAEYLKMVKADATTYQPLYMNTFDFISGKINTTYPFTQGEMTVGGLFLLKQGPARQINNYSDKFIDDATTASFEVPMNNMKNIVQVLTDCGFVYSNAKTK